MRRSQTGLIRERVVAQLLGGLAACALVGVTAAPKVARADSGLDSPDSGVVQMGRGSAWVARADDPLAAFFNPAAMAFQSSGVHLGGQLVLKSECFTRLGPNGQPVAPGPSAPAPLYPGNTQPSVMKQVLPSDRVCGDSPPFPDPQIAAVFRVSRKAAIGLALVAPHGAAQTTWPDTLSYTNKYGSAANEPAPQRYLLTYSNALIVFPTVSVAYAPLDNLSFGFGFVWGVGTANFTNFAQALASNTTDNFANDVQAHITAKDLFIPGVILSALWMPSSNFDIAGWFKWSDSLNASTNLTLTSQYWNASGSPNTSACTGFAANCNVTQANDAGTIKVSIPMEAKLGFRFHQPRSQVAETPGWASREGRPVRDPLSQDLFDVEFDVTYANNSSFQNIQLSFNPGIAINDGGGSVGQVPQNANIAHNWNDVVGFRLGGDVNVVPNRLALRAGGWFETQGQDPKYLNIDFDEAMKGGVAGGLTLRLGPFDFSAGYQHTFYAPFTNNGNGSVTALAGDGSGCANPAQPSYTAGCYRSQQAVNGGRLTENLNEFGGSATARW